MDKDFEQGLLREHNYPHISPLSWSLRPSPSGISPVKPDRCGDRFIPSRAGARWHIDFNLINKKNCGQKTSNESNQQEQQGQSQQSTNQTRKKREVNENGKDSLMYQSLLKNELLGTEIERIKDEHAAEDKPCSEKKNLFKYSLRMKHVDNSETTSPYSLFPIGCKSQKLLRSPRKIPKVPLIVLDAPTLQDDFYLNLVDWSSSNVLGVGLGACVCLFSACTKQVTRLCDLVAENDSVTSVNWNERANLVAVGTHKGHVQIWDATSRKKVSQLEGHTARVGALAWNGDQVSSGSRDRTILQRDVRSQSSVASNIPDRKLAGHRKEVCGLKWSPDRQHLASGGNDSKLLVWSASASSAFQLQAAQTYSEQLAAVKAIAWSPHQRGLLASGDGTADRCIRFWNTLTQQPLKCVDTGAQVCNLAWSKHASELVSTHGYSQNQILLWKYPSLCQVAKLTGHSNRVLYLATSPDGEAIVTGAGDETVRIWNVFSKSPSNKESTSVLNLFTRIR